MSSSTQPMLERTLPAQVQRRQPPQSPLTSLFLTPHPQYTTAVEAAAAAPVQSVNGETGTVVLDAGDVGADPAGTAATAVANHEAAGDPHPQYTTTAEAAAAAPVQQVNGKTGVVILNAADVSADPAGTAATAVSNHEAAGDPHPQYTTAAEASAAAPVQSVNAQTGVVVLDAADVGADPSGTAAAAVSAHEAASDPHPGYQLESEKGAANGYASLDGSGQVPASQLGNVAGGLSYQGTWNAATNTPTITSGVGTNGHYYRVSVAGTTSIDGIADWGVGDWIIFNGTAWEKIDNSEAVSSVFGRTGAVTAQTGDYTPAQVGADPAGTAATQVALHEAKIDPHPQYTTAAEAAAAAPVQSVNGDTGVVVLDAADVGADPAGTAAAAVSAHEAAGDPHPQYTTAAEASAAAPVQSVFGRVGTVVAQSNDYNATQVSYSNATSGLSATNVQAAIDEVEGRVDVLEAGVYGTQRVYASSEGESSTSSGTFQTKVTLTTPSVPAGTYRIEWYAEHRQQSTSNSALRRVQLDGVDISNESVEMKDTTNWVGRSGFYEGALSSGVHTVTIQYATENSTTRIRRARLSFIRVA
jgi:hypothetical protein